MEKVRFKSSRVHGWDGVTFINAPLDAFTLTGGFYEATLPAPAGRMAAGLFGKAPGGDPYVLHATMYSRIGPVSTDFIAVKTPAANYRRLWTPFPGNTRAALVRPDDVLEFKYDTQDPCVLELLLEPLAATNEFGPVLLDLLREESRENDENPTSTGEIVVTNNQAIPFFYGVLRATCTNGAAINLQLPDVSAMRLNSLLIVDRQGAGVVNLVPVGGQTINGVNVWAMGTNNRAAYLRGAGTNWSLAAV